jgi:hypothetical protein
MIDIPKAAALSIPLVTTKFKHQDYQRTVDLARKYKALMTGEDLGYLMRQFNRRESIEEFEQRQRITKHITPAICETLINPSRKLQGVKPVVDKIDYGKDNDERSQELRGFLESFSGGRSLDYYLSYLVEPSYADPNAFVVLTFDNFDSRYEYPTTYPVLMGSADVWDFEYFNNKLQYLWIHRCIEYQTGTENDKPVMAKGEKFTMYVDNHHIVFSQVREDAVAGVAEKVFLDEAGNIFEVGDNVRFGDGVYYFRADKSTLYKVTFYDQKSGEVPAFRIGWKRDQLTDNRTCVNGFHSAVPYLEKSLKSVSELDLTTALHVFPQKLQYVGRCTAKGCNKGWIGQGIVGVGMEQECGSCKGTGLQTITTAQDHMTLPLPADPNDMRDLAKFTHYVQLPVELIQQMRDIVKDIRIDAIQAVFGSDVFSKATVSQTATGAMIDMQSVYDAEAPHAMWWGFSRCLVVRVIAAYNDKSTDLRVVFSFPRNFKYETVADLIDTMTKAGNAGAGPAVMSMLNLDLIGQLYVDDPDAMKKAQTMERFNPYPGLKDETVTALISGGKANPRSALLWTERATIFAEAEAEYENAEVWFYDLDESKQRKVIAAIVDRMLEEEKSASAPPQFDAMLGVDPSIDHTADPSLDASSNIAP